MVTTKPPNLPIRVTIGWIAAHAIAFSLFPAASTAHLDVGPPGSSGVAGVGLNLIMIALVFGVILATAQALVINLVRSESFTSWWVATFIGGAIGWFALTVTLVVFLLASTLLSVNQT